jgi:hypothetical protein
MRIPQPCSRLEVQLRPGDGCFLSPEPVIAWRITHRPFREGAPVEQSQPPPAARRTRASRAPQAARSEALNGSLPAKSMDRADSAFENFSMSGFPKGSKPASYIDSADGPVAVHSAQRRIMSQQLNRLRATDTSDGGMTLALPESEVEKLLPSLNTKASTIELSDVLNFIAQHMRGTEFYANGNPVLNRLALRSRAQELIAAMKQEATADPPPHEAKAAPQTQRAKAAPRQRGAQAAPRQRGARK